jgi:RNA-directed DNA polymerase
MGWLLEKAMTPQVLDHAWRCLKADRGAWRQGVPRAEMESRLLRHVGELADEVLAGRYRPESMRCYRIAKADGGSRLIAAPPLRDKLVQRAVLTVLEPLGEALFHDASFGYRPGRSREMALSLLTDWVWRGWAWLGDADIHACFDSIPQSGALEFLWLLAEDAAVVELAGYWLNALPPRFRPGPPGRGLPQGMVLSPFLCNLYLHALDERLDEEGIPFARFADDFIALGRSRREAALALSVAAEQLGWLGLALHPEKTRIIRSSPQHGFLGYRLPDARRGVRP